MIILQDPVSPPAAEGIAAALGNFDGLHQGHRALLRAASAMAEETGLAPGVVTFYPHTAKLLKGQAPVLYTAEQKEELMAETGQVQWLIRLTFDRTLMELSPETFVSEVLRQRLNVRGGVVGDNFRFGCRGEGTAGTMEELCRKKEMACRIIPRVTAGGEPVCSTRIRKLVTEGRMEEAGELLARPYFLCAEVTRGKHLGTRLQVPTINLIPEADQVIPRRGVYVSRTLVDGQARPSVTNVGCNPTVGGEPLRTETHILDGAGDLYGKKVRVELLHFLRPEIRFENTGTLQEQLLRDIENARKYFEESRTTLR